MFMGLHDGAIDPIGKAKIICIHDQATHAVSLAGEGAVIGEPQSVSKSVLVGSSWLQAIFVKQLLTKQLPPVQKATRLEGTRKSNPSDMRQQSKV